MEFQIHSAAEFYRLRVSEIEEEYALAAEGSAPMDVWREVIRKYPSMRQWVAHNKTVPMEILDILATDRDPDVRMFVATKRKLSRELFESLSNDRSGWVRMHIAANPKIPKDILMKMAHDRDCDVRVAVQRNLIWNVHGYRPGRKSADSAAFMESDRKLFAWLEFEIDLAYKKTAPRSGKSDFGSHFQEYDPQLNLTDPIGMVCVRDLWLNALEFFYSLSQDYHVDDQAYVDRDRTALELLRGKARESLGLGTIPRGDS